MKLILKETQHFTGALVVSQANRSQGGYLKILTFWSLNLKLLVLVLFKRIFNCLLSLYRIVWLLLKNGARVSQGNTLGLTPIHSAAAKGNYKALQVTLCYFLPKNLMTLN
jgi:hypothetical protein